MPLITTGRFLVEVPERASERVPRFFGDQVEPLFDGELGRDSEPIAPGWFSYTPKSLESSDRAQHGWDEAHEIARQLRAQIRETRILGSSQVYVEPDIVHRRLFEMTNIRPSIRTPGSGWPALGGFDTHYSPCDDRFDLDWHIKYAGFRDAWKLGNTRGERVRIAHLDTGYYPCHRSTPVNMLQAEGRNYYKGNPNDVTDPGHHLNEGHGTATLALLAGKDVDLSYQRSSRSVIHRYSGVIGGAPGAAVVPVRIGGIDGSVIHLYSVSMAKGLLHALGDAQREPCDVVSLSHGGLPSKAWVHAINALYDKGIVVAAASGDSFRGFYFDIATHFTVYPAAWWRVITVTGETFRRNSYTSSDLLAMQGCWGPSALMGKSLGAFTPNVPWMRLGFPTAWVAGGAGTSASTPQVAAACALWLSAYGRNLPRDWRRVEACRAALFQTLQDKGRDKKKIGAGALDAAELLRDQALAGALVADASLVTPQKLRETPPDRCSWPLLRLLLGLPPPRDGVSTMLSVEAQQVVYRSRSRVIQRHLEAPEGGSRATAMVYDGAFADAFLEEPDVSKTLRTWVAKHRPQRRRPTPRKRVAGRGK